MYYFFFEKCRETILKSKAKVAAAAATTATATIANGGALTTFESILAGLIAGTATTVSTNPIWIVNTRQTVRVGASDPNVAAKAAVTKRLGFLQTMQKIVREEGPLALWKGLGPALVLVINPVLQYTAFEQLKNWVVKSRLAKANGGKVSLSDWDFFWLGALSKLFATGLTYPQIVIKSRQHAGSSKGASTNIWTAMTEIVQREGIAGLYRGITSKLLQSVLTAAILFASKERVFNLTKAVSAFVRSKIVMIMEATLTAFLPAFSCYSSWPLSLLSPSRSRLVSPRSLCLTFNVPSTLCTFHLPVQLANYEKNPKNLSFEPSMPTTVPCCLRIRSLW